MADQLLDLALNNVPDAGPQGSVDEAVSATALADVIPIESTARHPGRNRLPDHLPRSHSEHLPTCSGCPQCGGALKRLGEDVSEELEYVPARFRVVRHVRPKFACGRCEAIVQAPAPSRPIIGGLPGPGLLAHVLTAKYCDHLPLYRQSVIYAREGVRDVAFEGFDFERCHLRARGRAAGALDPGRLGGRLGGSA